MTQKTTEAANRHLAKYYSHISIAVRKEEKELFKQFCEVKKMSMRGFILEAAREKIEREL